MLVVLLNILNSLTKVILFIEQQTPSTQKTWSVDFGTKQPCGCRVVDAV